MTLLPPDHEHLIVPTERMPNVGLCATTETCTAIRIRDDVRSPWREPSPREAGEIVAAMLDAIEAMGLQDRFLDQLERVLDDVPHVVIEQGRRDIADSLAVPSPIIRRRDVP